MAYQYLTCCVDSDGRSIDQMVDAGREVKNETFRRKLGPDAYRELEKRFGYGRHLSLADDYHVRYFTSIYRGQKCIYMVHSAIEYIYVPVKP